MYIKHQDKEFQILLSRNDSFIQIKGKKNNIYTLSVPYNVPHTELIQYLNSYANKLIADYDKSIEKSNFSTIELYNKHLVLNTIKGLNRSYRNQNIIYSSLSTKSIQNKKKIYKEVLSYDIRTLVGEWEERLEFIIENIKIKSFKTKPFKVCHLNNTIDFSIHLINRDYSYLEFLVAKAIFELSNLDSMTQEKLLIDFVHDYKHSLKIYEYENGI